MNNFNSNYVHHLYDRNYPDNVGDINYHQLTATSSLPPPPHLQYSPSGTSNYCGSSIQETSSQQWFPGVGTHQLSAYTTLNPASSDDRFPNFHTLHPATAVSASLLDGFLPPIYRTIGVHNLSSENISSLIEGNQDSEEFNPDDLIQHVNPEGNAAATSVSKSQEQISSQFSCNENGCTKSYSTISGLNNHIKKKHSGPSMYPCDECSVTFSATHERTMHKIQEHDGRRYQTSRHGKTNAVEKFKCSVLECGKEFSKLVNLNKHLASHSTAKLPDERIHKCNTCGDVFNQRGDLVRHMRNRHTGTGEYPCPECSKVFYTFDMYKEHRSLHDDTIPKHKCDECGKQFISQRKLKEHSIIHKERIMFKCDVCSKVFVRSQTLQYHRITCKAAYPCTKCVDSFMTAEALEKHQVFHKVDDFVCIKCNKVFSTKPALSNHEKRHSLRMNYTCQICKEMISTRAKFQKHIKDHLESKLKCSVCNEEFQSLVKYGYHKAEMHSIMKPYDCVLCTDQFCTRHELFMHLHNHVDVKTSNISFTCEHCGINFSIKSEYENHQQTHTKGNVAITPKVTPSTAQAVNIDAMSEDEDDFNSIDNDLMIEKDIAELDEGNVGANHTKHIAESSQFQCDLCTSTFSFQSLLNHHRSTDHEIKRFPCVIDFCDQVFDTTEALRRHEQFRHTAYLIKTTIAASESADASDVKCLFTGCGLVFASQHLLKRHQSSHRLKTYQCKGCAKKYYSEAVYQTHVRLCQPKTDDVVLVADEDIDSGPVLCKMCQQLFENRRVLKFHRKFCKDEEAEEEERKRVMELRASISVNCDGTGDIEEIYVKVEPEEEMNTYVPEN